MNQLTKERKLVEYVLKNAQKGNPTSVLTQMDNFTKEVQRLMHIGDKTSKLMKKYIDNKEIKVAVELGAYCGYSSIWTAMNIAGTIYSIEIDPEFVEISRQMIEFAGLSHKIEVIEGTVQTRLDFLKKEKNLETIDYLFIDHHKDCYIPDFKLIEESGLLTKGSLIIADNILHPGAPEYQKFIENNENYQSKLETADKYLGPEKSVLDGIMASIKL